MRGNGLELQTFQYMIPVHVCFYLYIFKAQYHIPQHQFSDGPNKPSYTTTQLTQHKMHLINIS